MRHPGKIRGMIARWKARRHVRDLSRRVDALLSLAPANYYEIATRDVAMTLAVPILRGRMAETRRLGLEPEFVALRRRLAAVQTRIADLRDAE